MEIFDDWVHIVSANVITIKNQEKESAQLLH